ncbi:MAG: hypothetical protein J0L81_15000 [Caulobacterales bacterium]|jgi:nitrogen fixation/metabolism regulation signal transduction histidine kinase|nr:hypothetical protein [Caulobacterales bacterium]
MASDRASRNGALLLGGALLAALGAGLAFAQGGVWLWLGLAVLAVALLIARAGARFLLRELNIARDQAESFALGDPSAIVNQGELSRLMTRGIERFSAERREAAAQAQFQRALLDRLSTPVLGQEVDGSIIGLNTAGCRLLGAEKLSADDALTRLGESLRAAFAQSRNGAPPDVVDLPSFAGARRQRVASANISSATGPLTVIALTDIEGELEAAELAAWRTQARILTHEVMNGLTPVISMAQSAAAGANASTREVLSILERRAALLLSFVERYRELSQPLTAQRRSALVADILQDATGAPDDHTTIKIEPADLRAEVDPALATRAIANLVKNAREAIANNASGGHVVIHAWLSDEYRLVIDVNDNGDGFSTEAEANLFQPFFSTKRDGMGIGLAIARQVAAAHKGALTMMRSPLGGARLRLVL